MFGRPSPPARRLAVICAAGACWAFSFGAGAPLASLWLKGKGYSDTVVGLNTGTYYLGIAAASALVPVLLRRWGHRATAAGMAFCGATVLLFPWGQNLAVWLTLSFFNGVAGALSLIPMETEVNQNAAPEQRARDFGLYAVSVASGIALGTVVGLHLSPDLPRFAFAVGGAAAVLAALVVHAGMPPRVALPDEGEPCPEIGFRRNLLSYGSAWSQGFLEGGMVGHLAVYLLFLGLGEGSVSWLMGGLMIGVIAFQVPVAWLADRFGRTRVLLACYAVTGAALAALPLLGPSAWLCVCLFLAAACSAAFYPLGMTLLGERVPVRATAPANARYLFCNCLGSLTGPALCGVAMDLFGKPALFLGGEAALLLVLGVWVLRKRDREGADDVRLACQVETRRAA